MGWPTTPGFWYRPEVSAALTTPSCLRSNSIGDRGSCSSGRYLFSFCASCHVWRGAVTLRAFGGRISSVPGAPRLWTCTVPGVVRQRCVGQLRNVYIVLRDEVADQVSELFRTRMVHLGVANTATELSNLVVDEKAERPRHKTASRRDGRRCPPTLGSPRTRLLSRICPRWNIDPRTYLSSLIIGLFSPSLS